MAHETDLERNLANWEDRVPIHVASQTYDLAGLAADPRRLTRVIERDLERLGRLDGLDVLHLQCHIGTDTLSLHRLGARAVTGYDFSPSALAAARRLAADAGVAIDYVEGDAYQAVAVLGRDAFDLVYTGAGALCWLPDIRRWAEVVAGVLRPGGALHLHEAHPVLLAIDHEREDGDLVLRFPYFETVEPVVIDSPYTYTDGDATLTNSVTSEWNHGLGEIVQALLDAGLQLMMLEELRYCDWNALPHVMVTEESDGKSVLTDRPELLPLSYTLRAIKPPA